MAKQRGNVPLKDDFKATLKFVRKLRQTVLDDPLVPSLKGGVQTNPAYVTLSTQEVHLRGLAQLIGPLEVEKDLMEEFRQASEMAREFMPLVEGAPVVDGERHLRVRNPYAVLLTYAQTHVRGCAALLQKAAAHVNTVAGTNFDELFREPEVPEVVREEP